MNFLKAEPAEIDGVPALSMLGMTVPLGRRDLGGARQVIAGLRPEHFSHGEGAVSMKLCPTLVESLGSEKYVYFDCPEHRVEGFRETEEERSKGLIARIGQAGGVKEGKEVTISFNPEDLYLFDAKTTLAIR